jgi:NifU-like protein involved in Fe-S cluster formation
VDTSEIAQLLSDHLTNPRHFGEPEKPARGTRRIVDRFCRVEITFCMLSAPNKPLRLKFFGSGCSTSMAFASLLTEQLQGLAPCDGISLCNEALQVLEGRPTGELPPDQSPSDERLLPLLAIRAFATRRPCAALVYRTVLDLVKVS